MFGATQIMQEKLLRKTIEKSKLLQRLKAKEAPIPCIKLANVKTVKLSAMEIKMFPYANTKTPPLTAIPGFNLSRK